MHENGNKAAGFIFRKTVEIVLTHLVDDHDYNQLRVELSAEPQNKSE